MLHKNCSTHQCTKTCCASGWPLMLLMLNLRSHRFLQQPGGVQALPWWAGPASTTLLYALEDASELADRRLQPLPPFLGLGPPHLILLGMLLSYCTAV